MKVKTNLRAGAGNQKRSSSTDSTSVDVSGKVVAPPPVSRCFGV